MNEVLSPFLDQYEFPVEDRVKQIFLLFEGVCPTCGEDNEIVEVSGTEEFHGQHHFSEGKKRIWGPVRSALSDTGSIEFICASKHKHCIVFCADDWM